MNIKILGDNSDNLVQHINYQLNISLVTFQMREKLICCLKWQEWTITVVLIQIKEEKEIQSSGRRRLQGRANLKDQFLWMTVSPLIVKTLSRPTKIWSQATSQPSPTPLSSSSTFCQQLCLETPLHWLLLALLSANPYFYLSWSMAPLNLQDLGFGIWEKGIRAVVEVNILRKKFFIFRSCRQAGGSSGPGKVLTPELICQRVGVETRAHLVLGRILRRRKLWQKILKYSTWGMCQRQSLSFKNPSRLMFNNLECRQIYVSRSLNRLTIKGSVTSLSSFRLACLAKGPRNTCSNFDKSP